MLSVNASVRHVGLCEIIISSRLIMPQTWTSAGGMVCTRALRLCAEAKSDAGQSYPVKHNLQDVFVIFREQKQVRK